MINPINDAEDVGKKLQDLGFDTTVVHDADVYELENAVNAFADKLRRNPQTAGIFYYAGHAVQSGGINYLLPVDANIRNEAELRRKAIAAQEVLNLISQAYNSFNMVILDACRDNPFAGSFRSTSRGLAATTKAPPETLLVYSTDAGDVAADGSGRNSPFTEAFLANVSTPGIDVEEMIRNVSADVNRITGQQQRPWRYSSLTKGFSLNPLEESVAADRTQKEHSVAVGTGAGTDRSDSERVQRSMTNGIGMTFVAVEGGSFWMGSRRVQLRGFEMATTEVTQQQYERIMGTNPSDPNRGIGPDYPVNRISWYDAIVYANRLSMAEGLEPVYTIRGSTDPGKWGQVPLSSSSSWNAVTMNQRAGGYRLPTEAEWEFAARGGNKSRGYTYAGGNNVNEVAWHSGNSSGTVHPVTTKAPNELGLYDMSGNVWEWCWDRYDTYPNTAQTDPAGPSSGKIRVRRGGGWDKTESFASSDYRIDGSPSYRGYSLGFRLARSRVR